MVAYQNNSMDLTKVIPISKKSNNTLNKLSDSWSFWSEGSVSFGKTGDTSSSSSKKINTKLALHLEWIKR